MVGVDWSGGVTLEEWDDVVFDGGIIPDVGPSGLTKQKPFSVPVIRCRRLDLCQHPGRIA